MKELSTTTQDLLSLLISLIIPQGYKLEIEVTNDEKEINEVSLKDEDYVYFTLAFYENKIYLLDYFSRGNGIDEGDEIQQLMLRIMKTANAKPFYDETEGKTSIRANDYELDVKYSVLVEILKIEFGLKKETNTDLTITIN